MPPAVLLRLIAQVRRRVVLGSLLRVLVWAWVAALALSAVWVFVQRLALRETPDWLCWGVPVVLIAAATALAVVYALVRAPSQLGAAMSLDHRFGLRERVTTSVTLDADTAATPAGQALLADAEQRAGQVRVADRFPVTVPWKPAAALPVCCGLLVLLAMLWYPTWTSEKKDDTDANEALETSNAVEDQMKKLTPNKPAAKKGEEQPKAEDLRRIEAEIDQFAKKPRDRRDDVRERIKDATALEEEIKRQQKEEQKRADAMRDALKKSSERLQRKNKEQQGPGKDAKDALARGDMQKARDELQRLSKQMEKEEEKERLKKKLKDPNLNEKEKEELQRELDRLEKDGKGLTDKEKEDLQKQIAGMQEMVERLTKKEDDLKKELEEEKEKEKNADDPDEKEEHKKNQEELERELEEMKQNPLTDEEKKELQELADQLKECKECTGKDGKNGEAAKKLAAAGKKAGQMCKDGDKEERARMLARMQAVRKALNRQMQQQGQAPGGPGGPASGKRPEVKDETGEEEKFVPGQWDKGKVQVVGQGPKGGKKFDGPRKPTDMKEEIKQAGQEAAAAIDRQRLPPSARKMTRDYFEKMRDKDKEAGKDEKKP